jgi:hypothetical protein
VAETHDPSSPEIRAGSSDIPLRNDGVIVRPRGALRPSEVPLTCLAEGTDPIAARDRELRVFCRRVLGSSDARSVQVEDAVDGVLTALARGMPIALRGASDLIPVAYACIAGSSAQTARSSSATPADARARARCACRRADGP